MPTADQIRAARAPVRSGRSRLAEEAEVSIETAKRLEKVQGALGATRSSTLAVLQAALCAGGVEFIPENGGIVRLRNGRS